ncbi:MAG: sulfurtransferase TusA family protein [Lachnospiraceae bacterium]
MYELDCLGDMCPIPIMKLMQCRQIKEKGGQLILITDHSCVVESITGYCTKMKLDIHIKEPINGIWELYIEHQ